MASKKTGAAKAAKKKPSAGSVPTRPRPKARTRTSAATPAETDRRGEKPKPASEIAASNAKARKAEADKVNAAAGTPPTPAERKAFLSKLVGELYARPDAQERIVRDALPTLRRYYDIDIPDVDMNVRDHAAPPAPGPMTRPARVDPADLVNADKGQVAKLAPPAGGDQAAATIALGEAQAGSK